MFNKEIARDKFLSENPNYNWQRINTYIKHPKIKKEVLINNAISVSKWREKYPEKNKAHRMVFVAVRNGSLIKKPCEVCGLIKSEAHHNDYSKPLEVIWLCKEHHVEADKVRKRHF